jgi:hypothetical protein
LQADNPQHPQLSGLLCSLAENNLTFVFNFF